MRYLLAVLSSFLAACLIFVGANILFDPYEAFGMPRIAGFNAIKPAQDNVDNRISRAFNLIRGHHRTLVVGSSRVRTALSDTDGLLPQPALVVDHSGASVFETARVLSLAAGRPGLECVVVGLDQFGLSGDLKSRGSYEVSPLFDGSPALAMLRSAFFLKAYGRAWDTMRVNLGFKRAGASRRKADGDNRAKFETVARGFAAYYRGFAADRERIRFLAQAVRRLSEQGVGVVVLIMPEHAWLEEIADAYGLSGDFAQERRWLAEEFAPLLGRESATGCGTRHAVEIWDFAGWRALAVTPVPAKGDRGEPPWFLEASHPTSAAGRLMLSIVQGQAASSPWLPAAIGAVLAPESVDADLAAMATRRLAYQQSPDGQEGAAFAAAIVRAEPRRPSAVLPIEAADYDRL